MPEKTTSLPLSAGKLAAWQFSLALPDSQKKKRPGVLAEPFLIREKMS
jgi:hypothetical protein